MIRRRSRRRARGMTLLEIMVSLGIMAMISLLIYGAFDSISRGRRAESIRSDRARQGRDAVERIAHELQTAFVSLHTPSLPALVTRTTGFIAVKSAPFDRVDFTAFSHRRIDAESKESDQCELSYFVVRDPDHDDKMDLVRREQAPIDFDFRRGGVVNVLAENVERFELKYMDPQTGQWVDSWDSTNMTAQFNRLPFEVRISLELKSVQNSPAFKYVTKVMIPMQQALKFGIPQ